MNDCVIGHCDDCDVGICDACGLGHCMIMLLVICE